jgi:hypothetical protein
MCFTRLLAAVSDRWLCCAPCVMLPDSTMLTNSRRSESVTRIRLPLPRNSEPTANRRAPAQQSEWCVWAAACKLAGSNERREFPLGSNVMVHASSAASCRFLGRTVDSNETVQIWGVFDPGGKLHRRAMGNGRAGCAGGSWWSCPARSAPR